MNERLQNIGESIEGHTKSVALLRKQIEEEKSILEINERAKSNCPNFDAIYEEYRYNMAFIDNAVKQVRESSSKQIIDLNQR